jgi:ankyrin repeat protein
MTMEAQPTQSSKGSQTPSSMAGVDAVDKLGRTALHNAAQNGCTEQLVQLIAAGADVEAQTLDHQKRTPLHLAAAAGHAGLLPLLITPATLDALDNEEHTPLQLATMGRKLEAATVLVAAGASLGGPGLDNTPFLAAMENMAQVKSWDQHTASDLPKLVVLLLNAMLADPGSAGLVAEAVRWRCAEGGTALHYAAEAGCQELVVKMVEAGADRNAVDGLGASPLFSAVVDGRAQLVPLLATPVNINQIAEQWWGYSPLLIAMDNHDHDAAAALLAAGAQLSMRDDNGYGVLHVAAQSGDRQWMRQLLEVVIRQWEQGQQQQQRWWPEEKQPWPQQQSQTCHQHHHPQQQQQQKEDGRHQLQPTSLSGAVAEALMSSAAMGSLPVECTQLLDVALDVLEPGVVGEVCQAVQQQLQDEYDRLDENEQVYSARGWHPSSSLAEALLHGWVEAEERLHAARQPLVARLQRLVPGLLHLDQQQHQEQQEVKGQQHQKEQVKQRLQRLVQEAEQAAAAGQEERALGLLQGCAALHLQHRQLHGIGPAAAATGCNTKLSTSINIGLAVDMWDVVEEGLRAAAYARVPAECPQVIWCGEEPKCHPTYERARFFRPPCVYTTFLAAWVRARQQLQQLPKETAATVVAAIRAAQQQQHQQQHQPALVQEAALAAEQHLQPRPLWRAGRPWQWRAPAAGEARMMGG